MYPDPKKPARKSDTRTRTRPKFEGITGTENTRPKIRRFYPNPPEVARPAPLYYVCTCVSVKHVTIAHTVIVVLCSFLRILLNTNVAIYILARPK
jgi:hypothetical protein